MKLKAEQIRWRQFTRHGDAVFRSLGREIRIGVLSVATLTFATPQSATAATALDTQYRCDTGETATEDDSGDSIDLALLQHGDLLFLVASQQRSDVAAAIADVTEGIDLLPVTHVAIVCKQGDATFALEASGHNGVWLTPIDSFFCHAPHSRDGRPLVVAGRLKDTSNVDVSVSKALTYVGRPYDDLYSPTDSAIYCSELVQLAYHDSEGTPVFPLQPMSFHDASGKVTDFWREYYRRRGLEVPEGHPGTNPGALSRSERIEIIHRFY